MGMTKNQEMTVLGAMDTFERIFDKQERLIPFDDCYEDGTRYKGLTRVGAKLVYDEYIKLRVDEDYIAYIESRIGKRIAVFAEV